MKLLYKFLIVLFSFLIFAPVASAQTDFVALSGKVVDSADGYPLIGVSVSVAGTRHGTVTDLDGLYELKVPKQQCEVLFSYVGYDDKVIAYNLKNASAFSKVVMYTNVTQLADVVVTGVYERKKESFTGASATFCTFSFSFILLSFQERRPITGTLLSVLPKFEPCIQR